MVVPLYGRSDRVTVRHATTSDGLQITDLEIMVFHKLHTDDATEQFGDGSRSSTRTSCSKGCGRPRGKHLGGRRPRNHRHKAHSLHRRLHHGTIRHHGPVGTG